MRLIQIHGGARFNNSTFTMLHINPRGLNVSTTINRTEQAFQRLFRILNSRGQNTTAVTISLILDNLITNEAIARSSDDDFLELFSAGANRSVIVRLNSDLNPNFVRVALNVDYHPISGPTFLRIMSDNDAQEALFLAVRNAYEREATEEMINGEVLNQRFHLTGNGMLNLMTVLDRLIGENTMGSIGSIDTTLNEVPVPDTSEPGVGFFTSSLNRTPPVYEAIVEQFIKQKPKLKPSEDELIVNVEELASDLALHRLAGENLVMEKNIERYNRYLKEYTEIIDKAKAVRKD